MQTGTLRKWRWKGQIGWRLDLSQQWNTFVGGTDRMATGPVTGTDVFRPARDGREKEATQMHPTKEQNRSRMGGKQTFSPCPWNTSCRKLETFWWTSNSLPSTIIFRSVNSFSCRCWFNSFNISVEQEKEEKQWFSDLLRSKHTAYDDKSNHYSKKNWELFVYKAGKEE